MLPRRDKEWTTGQKSYVTGIVQREKAGKIETGGGGGRGGGGGGRRR